MNDLTEQDFSIIGGALLAAVAAGMWMQFIGIGTGVSTFIDFLLILAFIGTALVAYTASTRFDGRIQRGLTVMSIGTGIYGLTYWAGYLLNYWAGYSWAATTAPPIVGLGSHVWHLFFNTVTFTAATVIAYGLFIFFQTEDSAN
jgi:hypothetical protein